MVTPVEKSLDTVLHRALVIFTGEFPARDLFAYENEDAVTEAMEDLKSSYPNLVGGALKNKALSKLWKEADRPLWEAKIAEMAGETLISK